VSPCHPVPVPGPARSGDPLGLRGRSIAGLRWLGAAHVARTAISATTVLVLARLLSPSDFGLQEMALVVVGLGLVLADAGLRPALIQRLDLTPTLASSAFWVALATGIGLMLVVLLAAPLVATFYREPRVETVLRTLSLLFPVSAARVAPLAVLERRLAFRRLSVFELCSTVAGAGAGIAAAAMGLGVWSLVVQALAGSLSLTGLVLLLGGWTPRLSFDGRAVADVAAYALNHTGARVVEYLSRNVHDLIVGRYLGAPGLGQYSTAHRLVLVPVLAVSRLVARILFPALSRVQGDDARMAGAFLEVAGAVAAVTVPLMLGLWAVADAFVSVALGPQWKPVGQLVRILAPVGALQSVTVLADSILLAKGRVDLQVRWNLLQGLCVLAGVLVGLRWGLVGVAVGYAVTILALTYPWLRLTTGLVGMSAGRFVGRALTRPMLAALAMVVAMTWARAGLMADWTEAQTLAVLIPLGLAAYLAAILGLGERRLLSLARELLAR